MVATVECFYQTGLGPGNSFDSISNLRRTFQITRQFPDVAVKQDIMLNSVKIATTFADIRGVDYCIINDMAYYVENIIMLNDNVAQLILTPDFVTTVSTPQMDLTAGWVKRRHYTEDEDKLFENLFDEPFVPQNEPIYEQGRVLQPLNLSGSYKIVVSSIDLTTVSNEAKKYIDSIDGDSVVVPKLPDAVGTSGNTTYTSHCVTPSKTSVISMTKAFNLENQDIVNGMNGMRSLGIESAISAAYTLPKAWSEVTYGQNGAIDSISDRTNDLSSGIDPDYSSQVTTATIINKKTFSGQFNKIKIFSMCSGDEQEFRIEDVINPLMDKPYWTLYADTKFNGAPGCKPMYYKGTLNTELLCAIAGANWQQTPFMYNQSSGFGFAQGQATLNAKARRGAISTDLLGTVGDAVLTKGGSLYEEASWYDMNMALNEDTYSNKWARRMANASDAVGVTGGSGIASRIGANVRNNVLNARQSRFDVYQRRITGHGQLYFPETPYLADYVGNAFYEARTRLSNDDTIRFDRFLSAYGYAVDEDLMDKLYDRQLYLFRGRQNHNYVQIEDAVIGFHPTIPLCIKNGVVNEFAKGVRIWHVAPSLTALYNNPTVQV